MSSFVFIFRLRQNNLNKYDEKLRKIHRLLANGNMIGNVAVECGICDLILQGFDKTDYNEHISTILNLITRYLAKAKLYQFFKNDGAIKIINSMVKHPKNANLQAAGCYAIRALAFIRPVAVELVGEIYKIYDVLKEAMIKHPQSEEVQKAAISVIWGLNRIDYCSRILWTKGFARLVLVSLKHHRQKGKIQEYGIQALTEFKYPYSLVRLGCIEMLLDAIESHSQRETLMIAAMKLMRHLASYRSNTIALVNHDAPTIFVDYAATVLHSPERTRHGQDVRVQILGLLYRFSQKDELLNRLSVSKVSNVFQAFLDECNPDAPKSKNLLVNIVMAIKGFGDSEKFVRHFLTSRLILNIVNLGNDLILIPGKESEVALVLSTLTTFSKTLVECRQSIQSESAHLLLTIRQKFKHHHVYQKAMDLDELFN